MLEQSVPSNVMVGRNVPKVAHVQNIFCQHASIYDAESYCQRLRFLLYAWDRGHFYLHTD